jgi:type I restriction enzyme R subunit
VILFGASFCEFFHAWRKTDGGDLIEKDGIDSLY